MYILQDVGAKNDIGNTPMHWACLNGSIEVRTPSTNTRHGALQVVKALLEAGADPSSLNQYDRTPVDEAISGRHEELLTIINADPRTQAAAAALLDSLPDDNAAEEDAAEEDADMT